MSRHGDQQGVDVPLALSDDPELALATADQDEWLEQHPCPCENECLCDGEDA